MKKVIKENNEILSEEQYQEIVKNFCSIKRTKTMKLYSAYGEYIETLENSLEYEQDYVKKISY